MDCGCQTSPLIVSIFRCLYTFSSFALIKANKTTNRTYLLETAELITFKIEQMKVEFITKEDLESFKKELIAEIRRGRYRHNNPDQESKEWLKSYEVRKLLGISPGTLQNLRLNGTLPFTKIGGLMYYRYEDIRALMNGKDDN